MAWWRARVGITAPPPGTTVISMFAYENRPNRFTA